MTALNGQPLPSGVRFAWLPSPWLLTLWTVWWLWRYAAVQALPAYGALAWPSAAGFLVDALLLDASLALLRWRAGDGELRGAARVEAPDPLGPMWLRALVMALLSASVLGRAVDGLHCYLAHAHMDAAFWRTLVTPGRLWELRYIWVAVFVTGWVARLLVRKELGRAARIRRVLARLAAEEGLAGGLAGGLDGGLDGVSVGAISLRLRRFVWVDAMRAALFGCLGAWLAAVVGGAARGLVVPPEWWAFGGLVELVWGGGG